MRSYFFSVYLKTLGGGIFVSCDIIIIIIILNRLYKNNYNKIIIIIIIIVCVKSVIFLNPREHESQHETEDFSTTLHMQLHPNTATPKSSTAGLSTTKATSPSTPVGIIIALIQDCSKQLCGRLV